MNTNESENIAEEVVIEDSEPSYIKKAHNKCTGQDFLSLDFLGRILTGAAFIVYGYTFLYFAPGSAMYLPSFIPYPFFWVISFAIFIMIAGLMLMINLHLRKAIIFLTITHSIVAILTFLLYTEFQILLLNIALIGGLVTLLSKHPKK